MSQFIFMRTEKKHFISHQWRRTQVRFETMA